jgi:hypothetical protein
MQQQNQLTIIPDAAYAALAVFQQQQQLSNPRRARDDFDMMADPAFFDQLVDVACYLEALRYYRKGADRFKVFTFAHIADAFRRSFLSLSEDAAALGAFSLDQWYFDSLDALPTEEEVQAAKFGPDPSELTISNMARNRGEHRIDWIGRLQELARRYPGVVQLLHSGVSQQTKTQQKMADNFTLALHYNRGDDAMSRLSAPLPKAHLGGGSGGGVGGRLGGGRLVGGW